MDWNVVNGITGIVSAICALISIGYFKTHSAQSVKEVSHSIITNRKLMAFLLVCSGWFLCCLSFLWVVEPFGSYVSQDDYQQFYGVMLVLPAILILLFGLQVLKYEKT